MSAAAPAARENQGAPFERVDARPKVTGEARYAADVPLTNLAYGVLVTTDIARGRVTAVQLEAARAVAGVLDIVSYEQAPELAPPRFSNSSYTSLGPLHSRDVHHDGQIVALVVADTEQIAAHAAGLVRLEYAPQRPSADFDSPGVEELPAAGNTDRLKKDPEKGDFETAYARAHVRLEANYATPTQTHNPIELFSTTAVWSGDQLTVYEPSQSVYGFRAEIAHELRMDMANVRVVSPFVGGAFGSKGPMTPRTAIVALAAKRLNRPVRCVVSREQAFTVQPYRAPTRHRIRLGALPNGRIAAFSHEGWELCSRVDNYAVAGTETTSRLYGYGAVATRVMLVKADRQTPSYMRSPPELPYLFPLECALDELAYALRMDPIELRRVNDTQIEPIQGKRYSSRHLMECYDAAAQRFNWSARSPAPRSMRDGEWLVGFGCATAAYPTNVAPATARVRLTASGRVQVQTAGHEIGTGVRTVAAQMAAEQLGVAMTAVTVETGDTELPPAPVAGGSNSTASICSAVLKACQQVRHRLFQMATSAPAGPLKDHHPTQLQLHRAGVVAPDGHAHSFGELFEAAGVAVIEEYAEFNPPGAPPDAVRKLYGGQTTLLSGIDKRPQAMYAFGAEFVEVRVHARTCEIRVPRLVGAFTAGRIMNTRTAHSQLMGGLIWGMSSALFEATELDARSARTVNRDLQDYLVPVNADAPSVDVILLPEVDTAVNPAGVKGLGELGDVGTNAAIANAIFHATGKRLRELPIRLEALLA